MRRMLVLGLLITLIAPACGSGAQDRIVRVDFRHDEFASHYWRYFPGEIRAYPGDDLVFKQEWTGEPHTVSFGTVLDEALPKLEALENEYPEGRSLSADEQQAAEVKYEKLLERVPLFDPYVDSASPAASLPCYRRTGDPPKADERCRSADQPAFDGRYAWYSSGFIPPSGSSGNTYRVPLSDDIEPGTYRFFCVIHFPHMQGKVVVTESDAKIPSGGTVNARAREEIDVLAGPLRRAFEDARAGRARDPSGDRIPLPVAGYHSGDEYTVAVDEFLPRIVRTKLNEPVTWTVTGAHTVSFDVPRYVPIYRVKPDGTVERNPVVDRAAGGSPKAPPVDFEQGPLEIDGGTWDGSGFISSGLLGSEPFARYTLRVSKPGRYRFACLVHPTMVGTLVVDG